MSTSPRPAWLPIKPHIVIALRAPTSSPVHKQPLLHRLLHLNRFRIGRRSWHAKRHLGHEVPHLGHAPRGLDLLVDERVVVLQAGAEPLGGEGGPDDVLVDGGGVLGPDGEVVLGEGVLVLQLARVLRVLEVEDGAVGVAEAVEALLRVAVELFGWGHGPDDFDDGVPELVVLVLEEEDDAGGVGAERGRGFIKGCLEDLLDAGVWDGGFGCKGVVCSAGLDGLNEGSGAFGLGRHCSIDDWGVWLG